jgi:hypothetical protein
LDLIIGAIVLAVERLTTTLVVLACRIAAS